MHKGAVDACTADAYIYVWAEEGGDMRPAGKKGGSFELNEQA